MGGKKRVPPLPAEPPFIGAGDTVYFEWAALEVCFRAEPDAPARAAIERLCPPPLSDQRWNGRFLSASSEQMVDIYIGATYDADPGEEDEVDGRWYRAAPSKTARFNADIERFVREAHAVVPILVAVRAEDHEAGGTTFSDWHHRSVAAVPTILGDLVDVLATPDGPGTHLLRVLLHLALEADPTPRIPARFLAWLDPGRDAIAAVRRGDGEPLRAALAGSSTPPELRAALPDLDVTNPAIRRAVLEAGDAIIAIPDVGYKVLGIVVAAIAASEDPAAHHALARAAGARGERPDTAFWSAVNQLRKLGDLGLAGRAFRLGLELLDDPGKCATNYLYGFIRTKRFAELDPELFDRCCELVGHDNEPLLLSTTFILIERRDCHRAVDLIEQYCDGKPVPRLARLNLAMARFGTGDLEGAETAADAAIAADDQGGHMVRAAVAAARGDRDGAVAILRETSKTYRDFRRWSNDWILESLAGDPDVVRLFAINR